MLLENPVDLRGVRALDDERSRIPRARSRAVPAAACCSTSTTSFVAASTMARDPWTLYRPLSRWQRVGEIHLGGLRRRPRRGGRPLADRRARRAVADAVWALYERIARTAGPLPTLIEWDNDVPDVAVLAAEAAAADACSRARPATTDRRMTALPRAPRADFAAALLDPERPCLAACAPGTAPIRRSASPSIATTSSSRWCRRWPMAFRSCDQLVGGEFFTRDGAHICLRESAALTRAGRVRRRVGRLHRRLRARRVAALSGRHGAARARTRMRLPRAQTPRRCLPKRSRATSPSRNGWHRRDSHCTRRSQSCARRGR